MLTLLRNWRWPNAFQANRAGAGRFAIIAWRSAGSVCQEALANVRKHAAARQVRVRLRYVGTAVRLTVTDDGKGFDPGGTHGGYGLTGMRDRVSQVGGTVEVASVPGRGTEVSAEVPG